MLYTIFNVIYVLIAVSMTALILMQQGSGAAAGSGFGGGASATVFGARGSANFLSKSTAILAALFMLMSLGMAIYMHKTVGSGAVTQDSGLMGNMTPAAEQAAPANAEIPQTPAAATPAATEAATPAATSPAATPSTNESSAPAATETPVEAPAPEPEKN